MGMWDMFDITPLTATKVKTLWTRCREHVRQTADTDTKGVLMRGERTAQVFLWEIPNLYDDSVNKVPPSLIFPPEGISLWCDFLNIYAYKYCCCLWSSSGYLLSLGFSHSHLFKIFISNTPKGILLSFIYFQIMCNNLVSDSIFMVLFTLLHTQQSKQKLHFILKTENPIHCQTAAPCPKSKFKKKENQSCSNNEMKHFTWFTLQSKSATAIYRRLAHWNFQN